jgi:hypothetical protein
MRASLELRSQLRLISQLVDAEPSLPEATGIDDDLALQKRTVDRRKLPVIDQEENNIGAV